MDKISVMLVIPSLVGGGAERVAVLLLQHLNRGLFRPSLVMFQDRCDYTLPPDVPVTCLKKKRASDLPRLVWRLRQIYDRERPDIVLSFMTYTNLIAVLSSKLSQARPAVMMGEHNHSSINLRHLPASRPMMWAVARLYRHSDSIVCVSQGVADDLVTNLGVPRDKTVVIYNPVDVNFISEAAAEHVGDPWFDGGERPVVIGVGRLTAQKGFQHLIRAFARARELKPCRLVILGDGTERRSLEALANDLGVASDVRFLGFERRTFKCMGHSDVFVLSSLWEGLGMVIIEAMACGVPVVATRCPSGPEEVITDGVDGLLVPVADENAMAAAIVQLLKDRELAARLAQGGRKRAEDFAVAKILPRYEALFIRLAKRDENG